MNKIFLVSLVGLSFVGCGEHPSDSTKLTATPAWGGGVEMGLGGDCHIDSVNDKLWSDAQTHIVKQGGPALRVLGWGAVSIRKGVLASDLAVTLRERTGQGNRLFAATTRQKRTDVADFFKNSAAADSGFGASINLSDIPLGIYVLEVVQHKDGVNYRCSYTTNIAVEK